MLGHVYHEKVRSRCRIYFVRSIMNTLQISDVRMFGVLSSDALLPEQTYIEFLQTLKATRPNLDVSDLNVQCDSISHATKEFRPLYGAFR